MNDYDPGNFWLFYLFAVVMTVLWLATLDGIFVWFALAGWLGTLYTVYRLSRDQ